MHIFLYVWVFFYECTACYCTHCRNEAVIWFMRYRWCLISLKHFCWWLYSCSSSSMYRLLHVCKGNRGGKEGEMRSISSCVAASDNGIIEKLTSSSVYSLFSSFHSLRSASMSILLLLLFCFFCVFFFLDLLYTLLSAPRCLLLCYMQQLFWGYGLRAACGRGGE